MKKLISLFLAILMIIGCCSVAFAEDAATGGKEAKTLKFNDNGKFKIMQINDTQDTDKMNKRTENFIRKAVAQEKPDLVVIPGDVCNDIFIGANASRVKTSLRNLASLLNELQVPFAYTPGNHDHDKDDMVSTKEQMEVFDEFEYNIWNKEDKNVDPGTYNIPVMSSDGSKMALNVYMIDSQNKDGLANGYTGCYPETTAWYKQKSDELKAANGGEVVPSVVFQHVPVKEIYQCLEQTTVKEANNAIFSLNDYQWYKEKPEYMFTDATRMKKIDNYVGEAPCSEVFDTKSGEYAAWLEKGDVIGAFFAHDHVNHFIMETDEHIIMGYNGGTGFAAYGRGAHRSIRVYEFNENDVKNYTIDSVYYDEITVDNVKIVPIDIMSTAIFGDILRFLARLVFITPWKGSR